MKSIFKHKFLIILLIILVGAGWYLLSNRQKPTYMTVTAERTDLTQEVSATGNVEPNQTVSLSFQQTGQIAHVYADVGDTVTAGQPIASLDQANLNAQVAQAQANLAGAQAKLTQLEQGSTQQEINVAQQKVTNAEQALTDAETQAQATLSDAYTKADDAIHVKTDPIFYNPRSTNPTLSFSTPDQQLNTDINAERLQIRSMFNAWTISTSGSETTSSIQTELATATTNLGTIASFLQLVTQALSIVVPSTSLPQSTIDTYTASVSTARTNVQTALANITNAGVSLRTAASNLALAQQEYSVTAASSTPAEIDAQKAAVASAQAALDGLNVSLGQTTIYAPFTGVITEQNAKVGQVAQVGTPMVSLISASKFKITANIPEVDIAGVRVGEMASTTLDAYGDTVNFDATVTKIDPAAIILEGVPTYKTTLVFAKADPRVKAGMTANINIITDRRANVIAIPSRAIHQSDSTKSVQILQSDGTTATTTVTTGLASFDGRTEITSGLTVGDNVILPF